MYIAIKFSRDVDIVIVLRSADESKHTYHIIYPKIVFESMEQLKSAVHMYTEEFSFFDRRVYCENGLLRLLYGNKWN